MQSQSRKDEAKAFLDSLRQELALATTDLQEISNELTIANSELESLKYNQNAALSLQNEIQYFRVDVTSMQNVRIKLESDIQLLHNKINLVSTELFKARDDMHDVRVETDALISQIRSIDTDEKR